MTDYKDKWETKTLYYQGKKVAKKSEPGAAKEWKLYNVELKLTPEDQYTKKAKAFNGAKGIDLLNEDNEGLLLTFKFKIDGYEHQQHGRQISRTIIEVTNPSPDATVSTSMMTKEEFYAESSKEGVVSEEVKELVSNTDDKNKARIVLYEGLLHAFHQKCSKDEKSKKRFTLSNSALYFIGKTNPELLKAMAKKFEGYVDPDLGELIQ